MDNGRKSGAERRTVTETQERRALLRDFKREMMMHPRLSVGFGLFWTWVWLVFQTTLFSPSFLAQARFALPGWIIPLSAYAVTFLVLGGLQKFRHRVPQGKGYLRAIPAAMSLGVLISGVLAFSPLADPRINAAAVCLGGLVMGAGTACLHVEWGRVLGRLGARTTILHGVVGTIIAACLVGLLMMLPEGLVWTCAFFVPMLSMVLLRLDARLLPNLYRRDEGAELHVPRRFLATSFTQGLSFGIVQAMLLLGGHQEPVVALSASSFALAAVVLFFCALFFRMDFNQLIYQVGFLVMAFGYLLLSLVGTDFLPGLLVQSTGYRIVDILMWALCTYLIKQRGLPTNWVFAITTCFLLLGQICGALVGNAVIVSFSLAGAGAHALAIVMSFVLLAVSLLLSDRKNLQTGWGMVRPGDEEALPDRFAMGCSLVARQHDLTAREQEVLALLAQGRSRAAISDELTLSKETVKTHIRNIYRKMNVHSQQEVAFAVESEQRSFGFDEEAEVDLRL